MATIKGLTLEIGGDITPLNKAMGEANKTTRDLQGELRNVERLLKYDPSNVELLTQRQKALTEVVDSTKEKLDTLKEAERQAQEQFAKGEISEQQYRALQREVIKTEQDLEKFEKRLKDTNPKLEAFGAKAKETGDKLKDMGGKMTKSLTVPIAAAGAGLVAVGTKFDDVYDNIRVGTGATGEALQGLKDDFKAIAKEVPASLDDVGVAVADYNTRLGISGENLQELSKQTLELSRLTGEDLSTVIEETSQSFQAFNIPAEEYGQKLDFIFKVSQDTGIGITRLEQNMVRFSPTLKTLGFDFEQSAVLMGQMDKAGVDVEQAMAGLTKAMGTLAKKGVTDADEAIKILFDKIKDAPNDMEGANAALEIFGARAGPTLAKSIREGKFEYQDLMAELQGSDETILGVADETKDFAERFIELKNNVMLALEPLGEQLFNAINDLVPLFQKAVEFIGGLVEKFANLSPTTQKVILVVAGLAAAIGPLLTFVGTLTAALPALAGAFSVLMGPVGLVIGIIAALIAIGVLLYKNWDKIKEMATKAWAAIVDTLKGAIDKIKNFFSTLLNWVKENWKEILLFITNPIAGAIALLYKLNPKFKEWVDNLIANVKEWLKGMVEAGKDLVKGIWQGISDSWDWLVGKIKEWTGNILSSIKSFFGISSPSKYTAEFGRYLVQGVAEGIAEDMSAEEAAEQKVKAILDKFKKLAGGLATDKDIAKMKYDLWLVENEEASEAEKLYKQAEYLAESYEQQAEAVNLAEMAYTDMVERTGEASDESKELEKQLLQEKKAYAELYNEIKKVNSLKSEMGYMAQRKYDEFMRSNYKSLSAQGVSASDIYSYGQRISGLDNISRASGVTINQTITTTDASPSEIREAARDGARLATKEAYA